MRVAWLVIDDGREDYLSRCMASASRSLPVETMRLVLVTDPAHELGFAGAIQEGWERVLHTGCDWVFHVESDFLFTRLVELHRMIGLLQRRPYLAQVALKRQPWNDQEKRHGGIVECYPHDFFECRDGDVTWTEHGRFFTTNPSVYSTALCRVGWPQVKHSEGIFTHQLLDQGRRFAFWGGKLDQPRVEHIGVQRAGNGY
jgi:hypothetical protein